MIIGLLQGNRVELGSTDNGLMYKNFIAFETKSDEITVHTDKGYAHLDFLVKIGEE